MSSLANEAHFMTQLHIYKLDLDISTLVNVSVTVRLVQLSVPH
jgi:hypothetical protein